jgi:hypothetical protein
VGRIGALDGLRGWCLVFMMITHLHVNGAYLLGYLHFNQITFADSAQAFIFLSGLLVGLIGVKQQGREGTGPVAGRFWRRALELYAWHLALLVLVLALAWMAPAGWFAWRDWLQHLLVQGGPYVGATATLLYQPTYLDILPQYILYLLAAPALVHLVAKGRAGLVLALSLGVWLAVQLGLDAPLAAWVQEQVRFSGQAVTLRTAFNPLAWQLLFVLGLVLGGLLARGELPVKRLLTGRGRMLGEMVLGLLVLTMAVRVALQLGTPDAAWLERLRPFEDRQSLALLRLVSFAGVAYLTAWLLASAPDSGRTWVRRAGTAARHLLGHPWFGRIGRHSLPVFAFHVVLVYLLRLLDTKIGGIPDPWYSLLAFGAILSLGVPALILDGWQRRPVVLAPVHS